MKNIEPFEVELPVNCYLEREQPLKATSSDRRHQTQ